MVCTLFLAVLITAARADTTTTYTGTLATEESTVDIALNLSSTSNVTLQTFGFGGGTDSLGNVFNAGGVDPFLAIFNSAGNILTSGGNPYGTSAIQTNYSSFQGCPPANPVGGGVGCGDITMSIPDLAAGTYTIVLSDGQYFANAIFDNGNLSEGFTDFTGGTSNFCDTIGLNCTGAYALDVTTAPTETTGVPEPAPFPLLVLGLLGLGIVCSLRRRLGNLSSTSTDNSRIAHQWRPDLERKRLRHRYRVSRELFGDGLPANSELGADPAVRISA
ncbi:MAG: DVUA0089 family protein [Candidatus Acidiferrum sp.]